MASSTTERSTLRALLEDFERVLASEYEALRVRDAEALTQAARSKQQLVTTLNALGSQCAVPPPDAELPVEETAEWAQIRALLARCALANRTNGAAIDASRTFVTSLLDLLCGRGPGERVYDARGRIGDAGRTRAWDSV